MSQPRALPVWDRKAGELIQEYMEDSPSTYETHPKRSVNQWLESHPAYDWMLAAYYDTRLSVRSIEPFIRKHKIEMADFEPVIYRSYADFFERRFKPGVRKFPRKAGDMGAFAEARYMGWEKVEESQRYPIKGHSLSATEILGDARRAQPFWGGPVILARLSPLDYHHAHYFDDGETLHTQWHGGRLWTVNWKALTNQPDILFSNERQVNILETRHFGRIAFVEIGALQVGRILQVHRRDVPFKRGEEKSVFRFGGSAIIIFGEPGAWKPADDIIKHTQDKVETLVRLGEPIAAAAPKP